MSRPVRRSAIFQSMTPLHELVPSERGWDGADAAILNASSSASGNRVITGRPMIWRPNAACWLHSSGHSIGPRSLQRLLGADGRRLDQACSRSGAAPGGAADHETPAPSTGSYEEPAQTSSDHPGQLAPEGTPRS